jgi:general transcription factor 3C polypeptide 5 (transcription factor C subunit 1)
MSLVHGLYRVEFPGYVQNGDRAISLLGGPQSLFTQFSKDSPAMRLSLRPNDPMSHPIESSQTTEPCLVIRIKVTRHYRVTRHRRELISTDLAPSVIGSSVTATVFRKPSDFQFLPALDSPLNEPTVSLPPDVQMRFLYIPPPVFIHTYKYEASYVQKRIFSSAPAESTKLWRSHCDWLVNQNDLIAMEFGPKTPPRGRDVDDVIVSIFEEMFEARPIWTALAIYDHLSTIQEQRGNILNLNEANATVFRSLVCVAYHVKTGPFKLAWVRYGVNPVLHPEYRQFQVVVIFMRHWVYADEILKRAARPNPRFISKSIGATPPGISKADALPDRLYLGIELVDLDHPVLCDLLQTWNERYSFESGWYSAQQIAAVRDFVMLKYQRMVVNPQAAGLPKLVMADITSIDQVKRELHDHPKKVPVDQFDFELMNEAQHILGIFDAPATDTIPELVEVITRKSTSLSLDRVHSY